MRELQTVKYGAVSWQIVRSESSVVISALCLAI